MLSMPEVLPVKNMVCRRCLLAVETVLQNLAIPFTAVKTGEIHVASAITAADTSLLGDHLRTIGLELIDNPMSGMIEKIKQLVITKARNEVEEKDRKTKLSVFLSQNLHHEYTYLSHFFSAAEGRTIENYFIEHRIEKVKELLVYKEMSLSAIHYLLEYSSVAHLSSQFKKVTGLTPSHFKEVASGRRTMLDHV